MCIRDRAYLIREAITELRERLVIEHAPYHTVVECKVPALELADAVVALAVLQMCIRDRPFYCLPLATFVPIYHKVLG